MLMRQWCGATGARGQGRAAAAAPAMPPAYLRPAGKGARPTSCPRPPSPRARDMRLGQLEAAEHALRLGGKRRTTKPRGATERVDLIDWLTQEVGAPAGRVCVQ